MNRVFPNASLTSQHLMEISGINFATNYPQSVVLAQQALPYHAFLAKENFRPGGIDIQVDIELNQAKHANGWTKIFDSGQSWSLFRDHKAYHLLQLYPRDHQLLWSAVFGPDMKQVSVYCGDKMTSEQDGITMLANPVCYPLDQILLMYILAGRKGALFHAAGVDIGGKCCIFPGKSGAGKSTLSRLFLAHAGPGIEPLSDDRMVVRRIDGAFHAFGTPWPGDAGIAVNRGVPLGGVFFIHKGRKNRIEEITPLQAFERLMPVTSIPWYDSEVIPPILDFCDDLLKTVPVYQLTFTPDVEAVNTLMRFIQ